MKCTTGRRIVCSYCRAEVPLREITKDHVIGESWYTSNAGDLEKWKVPACKPCNNDLSRVEREILIRLALCLDPAEAAHLAIIEHAMRAIDPTTATNPRDAKHRMALRQKIKREMIVVNRPDAPDVMPSFRENFDIGSRHAFQIRNEHFLALGAKWGKGLYRYHLKKPLPLGSDIAVYTADNETERLAFSELLPGSSTMHRGSDLQVLMYHAAEPGKEMTLFAIRLWRRFKLHCALSHGFEPAYKRA
jgi:hypothetical protein